MKSISATALLLIAGVEAASHAHRHGHHAAVERAVQATKQTGSCQFPSDAGLVAVTPGELNGGWAMSPDQECTPGGYCPYACPPGQVSMQWDPEATSYTYPLSMNGGLYCDEDGNIQKPFPKKPYCQDGTGAVNAKNKCSSHVSFCQTVLPGNEAMLIPTLVQELETLAVPDVEYWLETAAHFYINPPGYSTDTACVWGDSSNPIGNWSPFVAGANTDASGNTYVKIGWNPIYLELTTPFRDVVPDFGVEIECEGDSCNGLPCKIDPDVNGVNEMTGSSSIGAGGAAFCVVTVPKGESANIVVFDKAGSSGGSSTVSSVVASSSSTIKSTSTSSTSTSTRTSTSTTSSTSTSTSTSATPTSTSTTSSSIVSSTSFSTASSTSIADSRTTTIFSTTIIFNPTRIPIQGPSSSVKVSPSSAAVASASYTYAPHAFVETGHVQMEAVAESASETAATPTVMAAAQGGASSKTMSTLGLVLAVIGAVLMV
ncbi:hypothetical protein ASPACDRAFT_74267 [Aspergillus aculeatus ATCC 16872]|uniref:Uncharacterized protein n=1 Tax=Aspergillus aculeatus (strain ATCC 16872 / CBS 172.66 / WB 5094) TaxID=690307 RepID=A0A1L9X8C1_ASPA1|nr:uncharacterized protein ASPACDRAFT_74267 [Aspergillus aculeatus ATCC 16872]OJK04691.1 hypothetical protein ASPACDRAFT_74267 [Aspergillus aculeatus ATCC 16872]